MPASRIHRSSQHRAAARVLLRRRWGSALSGCRLLLPVVLLLLAVPDRLQAQQVAVDYASRTVVLALPDEPPSLNSLRATDQLSAFVLLHCGEGLLQYDAQNQLAPAIAQRWQSDSKQVDFWLRKDVRWSDGSVLTAHDFVFAWREILRPENAAPYANLFYPIRHAQQVHEGLLPAESLGVTALDDFHLRVELERPTPYFASLTALPSYYPLPARFYRLHRDNYGADADTLLFNGPFRLTRWIHGASLSLEKNPLYWNAEGIQLEKIEVAHITDDGNALLNLYRDNAIALVDLDTSMLPEAQALKLNIRQVPGAFLYFLRFNLGADHWTADIDLRRAIAAVLDPEVLVNRIVALPGVRAATGLYPRRMLGPGDADLIPPPGRVDLTAARAHLQRFLHSQQLDSPPELVLLSGDSALALRQAEYLQALFRRALGIPVRIDRQIAKQRLARERRGQFDISLANWGPDYDDLMTFADLFYSSNPNNRGRYRNPAYDRRIEQARDLPSGAQRRALFAQMQALVLADLAFLPLYESALVYVQHDALAGLVRSSFGGDPNFRFARILHQPSPQATALSRGGGND